MATEAMIVVAISIAPTAMAAAILADSAALTPSATAFASAAFLAWLARFIAAGVAACASGYTCRGLATAESCGTSLVAFLAADRAPADQLADTLPATNTLEAAAAGVRTAAARPTKSSGTVP